MNVIFPSSTILFVRRSVCPSAGFVSDFINPALNNDNMMCYWKLTKAAFRPWTDLKTKAIQLRPIQTRPKLAINTFKADYHLLQFHFEIKQFMLLLFLCFLFKFYCCCILQPICIFCFWLFLKYVLKCKYVFVFVLFYWIYYYCYKHVSLNARNRPTQPPMYQYNSF